MAAKKTAKTATARTFADTLKETVEAFALEIQLVSIASIAAQAQDDAVVRLLRGRKWTIVDTTKPTGVRITCPIAHTYAGRSLREALKELKQEAETCRHCEKVVTLVPFV